MIFTNALSSSSVEILSVVNMNWKASVHSVNPRSHASLSFRIKGKGKIKVDNQVFELNEASLLYVPAGTAYQAEYDDTEILCFHIKTPDSWTMVEKYDLPGESTFRLLFGSAYKAWCGKEPGYMIHVLGLFYQILAQIQRRTAIQSSANNAFREAVNLLNNEFRNPELKISELCRRTGICEGVFRSLFRQSYGKSPVQHLTQRRIEEAQLLLLHPSCSIERAAAESGFTDSKYFSRVVKKLYGCTPTQLRGRV